jgi:hypothetical protein
MAAKIKCDKAQRHWLGAGWCPLIPQSSINFGINCGRFTATKELDLTQILLTCSYLDLTT